jgi:hypothetical protein
MKQAMQYFQLFCYIAGLKQLTKTFPNKNVDIQVSVHDMFLEYPAGMLPSLKIAFN